MIELRRLSPADGIDVYDMLQEIPREENGFMNNGHGKSFEEYRVWLKTMDEESHRQGIVDGWKVPSTTYWLYVDGTPVGYGKVRHFLTDSLRTAGGNIGYVIRPGWRGQGYGKELLRLLLVKARGIGMDKALVTIRKDNAASLAVARANGGVITGETDERYLVWLDTREDMK